MTRVAYRVQYPVLQAPTVGAGTNKQGVPIMEHTTKDALPCHYTALIAESVTVQNAVEKGVKKPHAILQQQALLASKANRVFIDAVDLVINLRQFATGRFASYLPEFQVTKFKEALRTLENARDAAAAIHYITEGEKHEIKAEVIKIDAAEAAEMASRVDVLRADGLL